MAKRELNTNCQVSSNLYLLSLILCGTHTHTHLAIVNNSNKNLYYNNNCTYLCYLIHIAEPLFRDIVVPDYYNHVSYFVANNSFEHATRPIFEALEAAHELTGHEPYRESKEELRKRTKKNKKLAKKQGRHSADADYDYFGDS